MVNSIIVLYSDFIQVYTTLSNIFNIINWISFIHVSIYSSLFNLRKIAKIPYVAMRGILFGKKKGIYSSLYIPFIEDINILDYIFSTFTCSLDHQLILMIIMVKNCLYERMVGCVWIVFYTFFWVMQANELHWQLKKWEKKNQSTNFNMRF